MPPPSLLASLGSSIRQMMAERFQMLHSTIPPSEIVTKADLSSSSPSSNPSPKVASTTELISLPDRPTPTDAIRASVLRLVWLLALSWRVTIPWPIVCSMAWRTGMERSSWTTATPALAWLVPMAPLLAALSALALLPSALANNSALSEARH